LILLITLLTLVALSLAACGGAATPASTPIQAKAPSTATVAPPTVASIPSKPSAQSSASAFETKSNSGGSVTVDAKPSALQVGQPIEFDIALNTHSVDLSDDMTKITTLRDDAGNEYKPIAWEGAGPGGHHRSGTLKFAALASKPKYVELVIKGLATVPERVFRWDLSS
jgi:hypothetical protein